MSRGGGAGVTAMQWVLAACWAGLLPAGLAAAGVQARLESLRQVSGPSLFADCTADGGPNQPGVFADSEVETWVAINPTNPLNMVGTWQQDRFRDGGARGLGVGVSFDGGETWSRVAVPGLTRCSGGSFQRASDPWLTFAPNGDLHHIAILFNESGFNGVQVNRSLDGGLTWTAPRRLTTANFFAFNDKESITADPTDPMLVYAVWDRLNFLSFKGPTVFSRTTDGGDHWEPARVIHDPGRGNQTLGNQAVVQPDGTLLVFFTEILNSPGGSRFFLAFKKSLDQGETFFPIHSSLRVAEMLPQNAVDPETGLNVRDGALLFDVAVDPVNGNLYAVWQDGGLSRFRFPVVAFTMSTNGGASWSQPFPVNRTPADVAAGSRQAFLPSVHVSENGTVGVSYYDFRFEDARPGTRTDHWLTWCRPNAVNCLRPDQWQGDIRVSAESFDLQQAPFARGLFLGDYVGLAATGETFLAFHPQTHDLDLASVFARRIVLEDTIEPRGAGYWSHQVRAWLDGRGRAQESPETLLHLLADARLLHPIFRDLFGLAALGAVLDPERPVSIRGQVRRQLMAVLLNVASLRVPPFARLAGSGTAGVGETVTQAVEAIISVLDRTGSSRADLEAALERAEAINEARLAL
ncbi:MAG: sialidase family protein [Acidobacteriota bacterium]